MFEEEMSAPGKGVALDESQPSQPPSRNDESHDQQCQGYGCADEVQPAGNPVRMLAEVERIKLFKRAVSLYFIHGRRLRFDRVSLLRRAGLDLPNSKPTGMGPG